MALNKVAILIDGGFFIQRFKELYSDSGPRIANLKMFTDKIMSDMQLLKGISSTDILFRIF